MKISSDLRAAIRAASAASRQHEIEENRKRRERTKAAIAVVVKKHATAVKKAQSLQKKAQALFSQSNEIFLSLGLAENLDYICDYERFVAAGGALPDSTGKAWKYEQVMSQLAAATEKEGAEILKGIGINWT